MIFKKYCAHTKLWDWAKSPISIFKPIKLNNYNFINI